MCIKAVKVGTYALKVAKKSSHKVQVEADSQQLPPRVRGRCANTPL
jgi:hypothetical protein